MAKLELDHSQALDPQVRFVFSRRASALLPIDSVNDKVTIHLNGTCGSMSREGCTILAHAPVLVCALTHLLCNFDGFKDKFRCSNGKQYANRNFGSALTCQRFGRLRPVQRLACV